MFGIIGLLVVGYVAKNLLAVQEKKVVVAQRDIPMAIADIKPGTIITDKHLGLGKIHVDQLTREMLLTNRVIVGRVAKVAIKSAEPIKANQLYQPGELPPLIVGPGMRAVTVEVGDGSSMVDGMVKPEDHVDVLFTVAGGSGMTDFTSQGGLTMRLFEGVKILAINRSFTQGPVDRGNNRVTLELTEPQANVITLARDKGKITLTLNPNGKGNGGLALSNTERITFYEILGLVRGEKPRDPILTEIFRGTGRQTLYFDDRGRYMGARSPLPQAAPGFVLPPNASPSPTPQPGYDPSTTPAPMPNTSLPGQPQAAPETPRTVPTAALPQSIPN